jgi:hypothetical protein
MIIRFIALMGGIIVLAAIVRWLLSGIVPDRWFAAFGRWFEIGAKLCLASGIVFWVAVLVFY